MGIFNTLDDRELTQEVLKEHGYHECEIPFHTIHRKKIFHYTEILGQRIGIRQAYLDIFNTSKNEFRVRLGYIIPSQEHRFIWGGFINTESDLFDEELWAKTTSLIINEDRVNGTFNYQKYERTRL